MEETSENKPIKHICTGLLAHVDAGKTTLSEAILYINGSIRKLGRVDRGDTFFDTYELERARGITIFSKQAVMEFGEGRHEDTELTLLDTPGHVDFSAEMERTLQVLDYAVLVISGADGVQGHTMTLWRLLNRYHIPVFLFVNKMDQKGTDKERLIVQLQKNLSGGCMEFGGKDTDSFYEELAVADEKVLEEYLETGWITNEEVRRLIRERKIFPCYFGAALNMEGVEPLIQGMLEYMESPAYPVEFGAKVFKISRDAQGNRLTHMKITGGRLKVKEVLPRIMEKVNQIRIYSGDKYETAGEAFPGSICAVPGLAKTCSGMGLGIEADAMGASLTPVLNYQMELPEGMNAWTFLPKVRELEEEDPKLHIVWNEEHSEIQVQIMGEVQIEVLTSLIKERFDTEVTFGEGNIVYKETIKGVAEGVGHFEPLRHYAEVHLLMEPGEPGSGLEFSSLCSEDELDKNWQRLILTHLSEKEHRGVLTGGAITDMKITLIAGRAHRKHTEGGDFREATYRAVRQGLMEGGTILLEPYHNYILEVPEAAVGRAMMDLNQRNGTFDVPVIQDGAAVFQGSMPAAAVRGYQQEVHVYTRGAGRLALSYKGYGPCHNADEVIAAKGYNPDQDAKNPSGSIFCAHGAGFLVGWQQVKSFMHIESRIRTGISGDDRQEERQPGGKVDGEEWIGTEEVDRILERTFNANKRDKGGAGRKRMVRKTVVAPMPSETAKLRWNEKTLPEFMLVDGYNIIFAWDELKELARDNIDGARGRLLDILCNYQAIRGCELMVVFDAYRVKRHKVEIMPWHNIYVLFTAQAQTADQYIERFAHENKNRYRVTVATSDNMEQIITRGQGCALVSARELKEEVTRAAEENYQGYFRT